MEGFIFGILLYLVQFVNVPKKTYQKVGFDDTAKMSLESQCLDLICKTCGFRVSASMYCKWDNNNNHHNNTIVYLFQYSCEWSSYYA